MCCQVCWQWWWRWWWWRKGSNISYLFLVHDPFSSNLIQNLAKWLYLVMKFTSLGIVVVIGSWKYYRASKRARPLVDERLASTCLTFREEFRDVRIRAFIFNWPFAYFFSHCLLFRPLPSLLTVSYGGRGWCN